MPNDYARLRFLEMNIDAIQKRLNEDLNAMKAEVQRLMPEVKPEPPYKPETTGQVLAWESEANAKAVKSNTGRK